MAGGLVVIPTDTVYGLGTRPDDPEAVRRVFEAKRRPPELELPVLAPSLEWAATLGELGGPARRLAERFWPGAVTIVVRRTAVSRTWPLGPNATTIGLRVPAHPIASALLERTGPLAVTSANRSGRPTPQTCDEVRAVFGDLVEVYVCADGPVSGAPSTVVDLSGSTPTILREGRDARQIERWLAKNPELETQNGTT
jgi:tRNA threonylcarbamoyl adenosine modification protein (Sua5/YciO/YrdC/YwlC family)